MEATLETIQNQALALPDGDRAALAQMLWDSLDSCDVADVLFDEEMVAELRRRKAKIVERKSKGKTEKSLAEAERKAV